MQIQESPESSIHEVENVSPSSVIDYLQVIAKHRRMILTITLAAAVISAIYSIILPDIYTARAKILPPQQQSGLLSAAMMQGALASIGGEIVGESKTAKLYGEMLKIESLRDPIIDRFNLKDVYGKKYRQDVYKVLNRNVSIQTGKEGIITVSVDDTNAKRSADMANAFVDELKKLTARINMTGAANSRAFLEERIAQSKKELTDAENELKTFQAKYKLLDAQQQAGATLGTLNQLTGQLVAQEMQLNTMLRTYTESSQEVKNLRRSIAALRGQIARFEKSGTEVVPGFENAPQRGQEYLILMRRFKTAEAVYDMLTRQYETARLNEANDVSTIQVIQNAIVPERKSKPSRIELVIISTLIAFSLSVLVALFMQNIALMTEERKVAWKRLLGKLSLSGYGNR